MRDPFTILGVDETADDACIRQRYLSLVREFPPDRDPVRFQEHRSAYEALMDERKRLEARILHTNQSALTHLAMSALDCAKPLSARVCKKTVLNLLSESIKKSAASL